MTHTFHWNQRTLIDILLAIQRNFGSDSSTEGLEMAIIRHVRPKVALVQKTVAAGGDPKHLDLVGDVKGNDRIP